MARVSREHLDARRRQILDGATACFARGGFHGTSMQHILTETGLSAGAVYRYFRSKDDMIAAILEEVVGTVGAAFAEIAEEEHPPEPGEVVAGVFLRTRRLLEARGIPLALVMEAWSEVARTPRLRELLVERVTQVIGAWERIIDRYRAAGRLPADVRPDRLARALIGCAHGLLLQGALFGPPIDDPEEGAAVLREGIAALVAMTPAPEPTPDGDGTG
ncbi:TetR/AcrR family transcriptional regulator [Streptomyces calidiresistens]|uniref:TetR family transcriptional regulator n=1 Tax=Streptomyces calidiresistens TaxID=1485586 RepID=A0A7W3XZI9_9ACTN|nr:TetR/AcrR family transcriptional regulator [Streptomyces calidiresistens]MBB0232896.1 TetR family transcriptional regulator [Streptomyces calidiresistens]